MVVNLFYRTPDLTPVRGFGYLIPRSTPYNQNPERALGVIFSSEASVGQDSASGTKLTVMLGGHWWDGLYEKDLPDEQTGIEMARSLLKRHLHIVEEPLVAKAKLQRNAIPQYTVDHAKRMNQLHQCLNDDFAGSRLKVAGAWYTGVGINDCVRSGYNAARSVLSEAKGETGLEKFLKPNIEGFHLNAKSEAS